MYVTVKEFRSFILSVCFYCLCLIIGTQLSFWSCLVGWKHVATTDWMKFPIISPFKRIGAKTPPVWMFRCEWDVLMTCENISFCFVCSRTAVWKEYPTFYFFFSTFQMKSPKTWKIHTGSYVFMLSLSEDVFLIWQIQVKCSTGVVC